MDGSSQGCCVLGLNSTPKTVAFGLACAALGALAATFSWGTAEMEVSVSPHLADGTQTVSRRHLIGTGVNSEAGIIGEVVSSESCCAKPGGCPDCNNGKTCNHDHQCDDCAFCRARERRAQQQAALLFIPLHKRPDYRVAPPDILAVNATPTAEESLDADKELIAGEHLVQPDGKIKLGTWGELHVEGLTIAEIKQAVENLVDADSNHLRVEVSVAQQNSHVYYVITEGLLGVGDTVARHPAKGNETVLDAIASVGTINDMGRKRIWIARPKPGNEGDTIIPIGWRWTSPTTIVGENPLLLPGDRVFLVEPPSWMAFVESAGRLVRSRQANNESLLEPVKVTQ